MDGAWSVVAVAGQPADLFEPAGSDRPRFAVLHLHGQDGQTLAGDPTYAAFFAARRLACLCPRGGPSFWADRPCPAFDPSRTAERYLLDGVVPFCRQRWSGGLAVQGFEVGGQAALRLGFKHPDVFPVVGALSAAVDYHDLYGRGTPLDALYDSKEQCRQDGALLHVQPSRQPPHLFFAAEPGNPWWRGNDRLHEKLTALGVPHACDLTTRVGGTPADYYRTLADRLVSFLVAGLGQQARRLL